MTRKPPSGGSMSSRIGKIISVIFSGDSDENLDSIVMLNYHRINKVSR
jgi:hypothetical protein